MKKNKKRMIICATLFLTMLIIYEGGCENSYALSGENTVDELILNKTKQEELKVEISKLEDELNNKNNYKNELANGNSDTTQDSEGMEVIRLSFVEDKNQIWESATDMEISKMEESKSNLTKELELCMIKEVQLEKSIENEKQEFMKENNLTYISGIWPLKDYTQISSPFGYRIHPISQEKSFHKGVDIPAPQDTDVLASDDGIILFSGVQNGYGNVVKIKHFDGKVTVYAHNNENIVKEGDIVKKGQVISKVGTTGDSTGNHVHFETIVNEENINPVDAVAK